MALTLKELLSKSWKQEGQLEGTHGTRNWGQESPLLPPPRQHRTSSPKPRPPSVPSWPPASAPSSWPPQNLPLVRCWPEEQKQRPNQSRGGKKRVRRLSPSQGSQRECCPHTQQPSKRRGGPFDSPGRGKEKGHSSGSGGDGVFPGANTWRCWEASSVGGRTSYVWPRARGCRATHALSRP